MDPLSIAILALETTKVVAEAIIELNRGATDKQKETLWQFHIDIMQIHVNNVKFLLELLSPKPKDTDATT
jgi:hypothetical protein